MIARHTAWSAVSGNLLDQRFAPETVCQVIIPAAPIRAQPYTRSERENEALFGERLTVLSSEDGWVRVRDHIDGYEGYVDSVSLSADLIDPTHWVSVPFAETSEERRVQSHEDMVLGMNSLVTVEFNDPHDKFVKLRDAGWINRSCLRPIGDYEHDFVEVMERFLHAMPYSWGGRLKKDCSSLLQCALLACGYQNPPRDSGPQRNSLGVTVDAMGWSNTRRGDMAFWHGHVAVFKDEKNIIHATDNVMHVTEEPFRDVADRFLEEEKKSLLALQRFPNYPDLSG